MISSNQKRNVKKQKIFFTDHARMRCDKSGISAKWVYETVSQIPYFLPGEMSWKTSKGVLILSKNKEGKIIVKTFIDRYKYSGRKYHKGAIVK